MSQDVKKALTSVDRSTKSLVNAADVLVKTVADQTAQVAALTTQQVNLATDIEFKQNELESIDQVYSNKVRESNAELALRVKENADTVFETLLKERPDWIQNIPQKYIASYFKIQPESLSRIKNRIYSINS